MQFRIVLEQQFDKRIGGSGSNVTGAGIDRRLLAGAGIFGIGWGLSGICPGPGLVLLTTLAPGAFVFVAAMIAGMYLARRAARDAIPERSRAGISPAGD